MTVRQRLTPAHPSRRLRTDSYSNAGEQEVISRLLRTTTGDRFCIDIAAGNGQTMSNTLFLFEQGWSGLSVEMDGDLFKSLAALHAAFPGSTLFRARVNPNNVGTFLHAADTPAQPGFLSLDIDGYDFEVLDAIMCNYQPALICAEINEKIPPPLRFTVKYSPAYVWAGDHFYGQSICQLELLCARYNYSIVELEYNNAFLMPSGTAPRNLSAEDAYRIGYYERPDRRQRFPWNEDMEPLQLLEPAAAVDYVTRVFSPYHGQYSLDTGPS